MCDSSLIDSLSVSFEVVTLGTGFVNVFADIEHPSWCELEQRFPCHDWAVEVSARLKGGEVRASWCSGGWDEGPLENDPPGAALCVATSDALEALSVRGWLHLGEGTVPDQRTFFQAEASPAFKQRIPLVPQQDAVDIAPITDRISTYEQTVRSVFSGSGVGLVQIPRVGIVERTRKSRPYEGVDGEATVKGTLRLLRPNAECEPLDRLAEAVESLPGVPCRSVGEAIEIVAHSSGLLAVHVSTRVDAGSRPSTEQHLLFWSIMRDQLVSHVKPHAHRPDRSPSNVVPGMFDVAGDRYVCRLGAEPVVFGTSDGVVEREWPAECRAPSDRAGWCVSPRSLFAVDADRFFEWSADGTVVARELPLSVQASACAYNAQPDIAAWIQRENGGTFPRGSLLCLHPSWGIRQYALPDSSAQPRLAVLPDGRVLAMLNDLFIVTPSTGEIVEFGPGPALGSGMPTTMEEDGRWLWTRSPDRWAIRLPPRTGR